MSAIVSPIWSSKPRNASSRKGCVSKRSYGPSTRRTSPPPRTHHRGPPQPQKPHARRPKAPDFAPVNSFGAIGELNFISWVTSNGVNEPQPVQKRPYQTFNHVVDALAYGVHWSGDLDVQNPRHCRSSAAVGIVAVHNGCVMWSATTVRGRLKVSTQSATTGPTADKPCAISRKTSLFRTDSSKREPRTRLSAGVPCACRRPHLNQGG
jgi:hypothetical protein